MMPDCNTSHMISKHLFALSQNYDYKNLANWRRWRVRQVYVNITPYIHVVLGVYLHLKSGVFIARLIACFVVQIATCIVLRAG